MKLSKFLLRLGLLVISLIAMVNVRTCRASAAVSIPAGSTSIVGKSATYISSKGEVVPGTELAAYATATFPTIQDIRANNVSADGRLTTKTTKIYLLMSGTIGMDMYGMYQYKTAYGDVVTAGGKTLRSNPNVTPTNWVKTQGFSFTVPSNAYQEIDVNLTDLKDELPIYIGFGYTINSSVVKTLPKYYFAKIVTDPTKSMKDITLDDIYNSDSTISGEGEPNATMSVPIKGTDGTTKTYSATADSTGKFTIDLGEKLKDIGNPDSVTVTEANDMGDTKSATGKVQQPKFQIKNGSPVTIYPDDLENHVSGKTDQEVLQWLIDQSGMTIVDEASPDTPLDENDFKFSSTAADLASKIKALASGQLTSFDVTAQDSSGAGTLNTGTLDVVRYDPVFNVAGSDLNFGDGVDVPTKQTWFAPSSINVTTTNTQASGTNWYITANASVLKDESGNELNGKLVYEDGSGNEESLMDNAGVIASGTTGTTDLKAHNVATKWATNEAYTSQPDKQGIFLKVAANPYTAGAEKTTYSGSVTWAITNAPGSNSNSTQKSSSTVVSEQ
ncbi:Ig-like domain-containing protein [Levilactobacillus angrenensis]|uniref:Ig-like domain-containing protein n=1 Tax=Levilactobacillus angrenensis TaxID=2486020 RepID=A0ABW1UA74_9LACO|nr:Ig-like domain-containing protein [Levilactobacillus angrenensis]